MTNWDAVIVGGGPRAISTVERLTAYLADQFPEGIPADHPPIRIAIIDAIEVGAGATWRTDQPGELLNNTYVAETTIYPDESTPIRGALRTGPDLTQWADAVRSRDEHPIDWVAEEARELQPWSFPTRRLQGVYFIEQLHHVTAGTPVEITEILGTAVRLVAPAPQISAPQISAPQVSGSPAARSGITGSESISRSELTKDSTEDAPSSSDMATVELADGRHFTAPVVILAQGMVQALTSAESEGYTRFAADHHARYLAPGMPAEQDWSQFPAGENLIIQGLGANFFDVVGLLSSGRGGRFEVDPEHPHGRLVYLPSGDEPIIHAVSRRGVPYRAKADYETGFPPPYHRRFATDAFFNEVQARPRDSVNFRSDVWPTLARELAWAHLSTLVKHHPEALATPAGTINGTDLAGARWTLDRVADTLAAAATVADLDEVLTAAVAEERWRFQLDHIQRPTGGQVVGPQGWDAFVAAYIATELQATAEPLSHPRHSVNQAMGAIRGQASQLAIPDDDGLAVIEGSSAVADVHSWFNSDNLFLASGPPAGRTRELLALLEAGIVHLVGPEAEVTSDTASGEFVAHSRISGRTVRSRNFAEARMSKGRVPVTNDPLLRDLLETGGARIHRIGGRRVASDFLETTRDSLLLVRGDGQVEPRVVVLGIPAGLSQPGSAIGAAPGRPSPLLAGGDVAARHILARALNR